MDRETLTTLVFGLALYQLYVTARVLFAQQYSMLQRFLQILLIWIVPFFGALIAHLMLVADRKPPPSRDTAFTVAPGDSPHGSGEGGDHGG